MPAIVGQVRLAGISGAVTGIDMAAAFALVAAQGYDVRAMAVLLPAIEAGLVKAFNAKPGADPEPDNAGLSGA